MAMVTLIQETLVIKLDTENRKPNTMDPMTPTALPTMGSSVSRLEFIPMPWKTPTMILRESLVSAE